MPPFVPTPITDRAYRIMREVEDAHWWFDGMEAITRRLLDATAGPGAPPGRTVLDAGCGTGRNVRFLARYGKVTGLDFSAVALDCCRQRGLTRLVRGSANALPFASGAFDLVTSFDVLTSGGVLDAEALPESGRVLRPGGHLLVRVAAYERLRGGRHDDEWNIDHRYERGELSAKLAAAGFEVLRASYANTWLFPVAWIKREMERIFPPRAEESDLQMGAGRTLGGRLMGAVLASEARWVAREGGGLPFGLSLYAVGRKRA